MGGSRITARWAGWAFGSTAGPAVTGGIITPFYDSLLVKICASGRRFIDAARRMERRSKSFACGG